MPVDLELFKIFDSIASCGSVNKASQELHVTQSAVSQSLKNLEKLLDCKLFDRQRQGLVLTDKGRDLYENVHKPVKELEIAEIKIKRKLNGKKLLTVYSSEILTKYFVINKLNRFSGYDIRLVNFLSTKDMILAVENNECDFTIIKDYSQPKKTELVCKHLASLNYCIFYNPKFIKEEDIYKFPIAIKEFGSRSRTRAGEEVENEFSKFKNKIQIGHDSLIIDLVKEGLCVGFAPKEYLNDSFKVFKMSDLSINIRMLYKPGNENALKFLGEI